MALVAGLCDASEAALDDGRTAPKDQALHISGAEVVEEPDPAPAETVKLPEPPGTCEVVVPAVVAVTVT